MATQLKSAENEYGIKPEYGHFIGGEWVSGDSGKTIDLINPATGAVLTKIQAGNAKDIQRAVAAAKAAFPKWSESSPMLTAWLVIIRWREASPMARKRASMRNCRAA